MTSPSRRALLGGLFVLLLLLRPFGPGGRGQACSIDSFVPLQFYDHCRALAARIQETAVARKMGHPDAGKLSSRLLNAWVDFYLEHGTEPPPVFSQIPPETWMATMKTMGYGIRRLVDQAPGHDDGESALLPLFLLVNPPELAEFGRLMASWTQTLERSAEPFSAGREANAPPVPGFSGVPAGDPASFTGWLERGAVEPMSEIDGLLRSRFPRLQEGIRTFLENLREEWRPVVHADPASGTALAQELMPRLRRSVLSEHARWSNLLFH